jgi:hypothetical protein
MCKKAAMLPPAGAGWWPMKPERWCSDRENKQVCADEEVEVIEHWSAGGRLDADAALKEGFDTVADAGAEPHEQSPESAENRIREDHCS